MDLVPKVFHSIPMHMNPSDEEEEDTEATAASANAAAPGGASSSSSSSPAGGGPWHCDLLFLSAAADPTSVFAIGLSDPFIERHLFCTSVCVSVKERLLFGNEEEEETVGNNGLALHHQRPFAMLQRQQNAAIGRFLHGLSLAARAEEEDGTGATGRIKAIMLVDDGESDEDAEPDNDSVLTLVMHIDINPMITPIARAAGLIASEREEVEHVDLRFEFSRTARAAHVASLALMMASHPRLGAESAIGRLLGTDTLRLVCGAYRLRLHECRRHVWSE